MNTANIPSVELAVRKRIVIGRSVECDLVDDHCFVSRKHVSVTLLEDGRVELTDLDSSNGTSWRTGSDPFRRLDSRATIILDGDADICLGGIESRYYRLAGKTLKRGGGLEIRFNNVEIRAGGFGLWKKKENVLLGGSGETLIPRGSFTVAIGTSGGGKSLLMNAVSETLGSGYRTGGISLFPVTKTGSGEGGIRFVPQDDAVPAELTVEQVMQFAAELRLAKQPLKKRNEIIDDVLRQTGLSDARGIEVAKLSGGQRKRVSVAVDLLDYPQLLILDEPTSGLDAETELSLLQLMKDISRREGITVVCVTHSLTACDLADQIIVIGKKNGIAASCIRFAGTRDEILAAAGVTEMRGVYPLIAAPPKHAESKSSGRTGPLRQWNTIFRRSWAKLWGDKSTFGLTLAIPVVLGILVGLSQRDHGDSLSPYFFLVLSALWIGMSLTIRELIVERRIYVRDKKAGLKPSAYLVGKLAYAANVSIVQVFLLYLPACVCLTAGNVTTTAFGNVEPSPLIDVFGRSGPHGTALVVLFGVLFGGNMLGLIGSVLARTEQAAVLLQIFFLLPQILVSRIAYSASYTSNPMDWHSGPFSLMRNFFGPLEYGLQRGMDLVSLVFVSRFGVSIMEATSIRHKYTDRSFGGDIAVEWLAFIAVLAFYAVVLRMVFMRNEKRWGLR